MQVPVPQSVHALLKAAAADQREILAAWWSPASPGQRVDLTLKAAFEKHWKTQNGTMPTFLLPMLEDQLGL